MIYYVDDNDKFFRYTRKQRLRETQRLKHQKIINDFKNENNLKGIETSISDQNSKTCNYVKFKQYWKQKIKRMLNYLNIMKKNL